MNNSIKNTYENITPTGEQKARMLSNIESEIIRQAESSVMPARRSSTKWLKVAAVAAALCCTVSITAFAEEIGSLFNGLFVKDEIVAQTVLTGVYNDNDGHVNMAVEELLSDGMTVRIVVRYQALDEQGKEWLDCLSYSLEGSDIPAFYGLNAFPEFMDNNSVIHGVSYAHGVFELEDLRTENERCFVVIMEAARYDWGSENIILDYSMTSGPKSSLLNVSSGIEKATIALDAPADSSKPYTPLSATISPLSFVIEGEEHGLFESGYEDGWYYQRVVSDETIDSIWLCFTDGTKIDLLYDFEYTNGAWMLGSGNESDAENYITIFSTSFKNPIDISTVAGFKLDGVYYEFN